VCPLGQMSAAAAATAVLVFRREENIESMIEGF
jgi:hypothetical protein